MRLVMIEQLSICYYSDAFFKTLFNKRYPLLAQLKEEKYADKSWKEYYLLQLYCLDLLKNETVSHIFQ